MFPWMLVVALGAAQDLSWEVSDGLASPSLNLRFGAALSPVGDLDGDGVAEVLVGAPGDDLPWLDAAGSATVLSGASGAALRIHSEGEVGARFGASVTGGSDVDGDGVPDYAVGAPRQRSASHRSGRVHLFSGASGALLRSFDAREALGFGVQVAFLGDHDGDGIDDLGVCSRVRSSSLARSFTKFARARVSLHSGATGRELFALVSEPPKLDADASICRLGDLNGDGVPEIAAGFPGGRNGFGPHGGYVLLLDGLQRSTIAKLVGDASSSAFGAALSRLGDVDRDGVDDFAVAEPDYGSAGRIHVHSGRSPFPRLYSWLGAPDDHLGTLPVDGRLDFDADGLADVLVGNARAARNGSAASTAYVYSGRSGRLLYGFRNVDFSNVGLGRGAACASTGDLDGDSIDDVVLGAPDDGPGWAAAHLGRKAFLQADKETYRAGETVRLEARGRPGHMLVVAIIEVSGFKTYVVAGRRWLDALGEATFEVPVPPGLSGQTMTAIARVFLPSVPAEDSLPEKVVFQ